MYIINKVVAKKPVKENTLLFTQGAPTFSSKMWPFYCSQWFYKFFPLIIIESRAI